MTEKWVQAAQTVLLNGMAYIDGKHCAPRNSKEIRRISPIDGRPLVSIAACEAVDVDDAVCSARKAYADRRWSHLAPEARKRVLLAFADLLEKRADELALMDTLSMGKPITQCLTGDIADACTCIRWYAESIDKLYDECLPNRPDLLGLVTREPLGVVATITPWNYPVNNVAWKIAPALAAGNSVVLKPAEQSTYSAVHMAQLATEAGLPDGVFNVVPGQGQVAGHALAMHPGVDGVFFTGSTATGRKILKAAAVSNLKKVGLELGGKSPFIILDGCSKLKEAAKVLARCIFINQGQTCSAPSRLIISPQLHDEFLALLLSEARLYVPGNPLIEGTVLGPLCSHEQLASVMRHIRSGLDEGAHLVLGGREPHPVAGGAYCEPTIFVNASPRMRIAREEIFGPVLTIIQAKGRKQAVALANDSDYGLAAAVWTDDITTAHTVARELRAGVVYVNCYAKDGITAPFGGYKQSGNGCKDKSLLAFDDYMQKKTTIVQL